MFHPSAVHIAPMDIKLFDVQEITLKTPDGEDLVAWHAPPEPGKQTLFYLHGNAGALFQRASRIRLYRAAGYGLFMLAYRGFSGSTGAPSEENIIADAMLAYDFLRRSGVEEADIVVYGESLGTGVAVQLAANRMPGGVVLESPFSSAVDVGTYLYPYLPVRWLLRDRFESIRYIGQVKAPILVLHGEQDNIVPASLGRKLFAAAPPPKMAYFIGDATHYTLYEHGAFNKIRDFLGHILKPLRNAKD